MTKRKLRARRARQQFLRDAFFRDASQGLEQLEERRLLSASPLTPDRSADPAWFGSVADPAQTTRLGQVFLDSVDTADDTTNRVDQSRWIVQLTDDALGSYPTPAATAALFAGTELEVLSGLGLQGQLLVGAHCTTTGQAIDFLANHPDIRYFEADSVHVASVTPNDPRFDQQFGLHNTGQGGGIVDADIDAPEAWEISTGSRDVVVAVVDTGIAYTHPDLAANIWTNPGEIAGDGQDNDNNGFVDDIHGWDFRNDDADPMDDHRHGTHVAGIIGAVGNNNLGTTGVAWKTSLMALKFLDSNNAGYTSDSVRAINYATMMRTDHDINVRVINNSYTGQRSIALEETIAATAEADILLVTAAGNGNALGMGYDIDSDPVYPASIPATNSIVVGASGQFDELARFSNYGQNTVDLLAPGVGIVSTVPPAMGSYASLTGTSMAAPMVTGTAALIASNLPDITVAELQAAILGSVDTADELTGKVKTGGRLNTAAAVTIDTYRPRVTLVSSNNVSSFGGGSYPLQVTVRDNVGINLDSLDNNDLQLIDSDGRALDTVISKETVTGSSTTEKTVTYHANAPTGGWDSSFNDTYDLVAIAGQYADTSANTNLSTTLGQFEVEISLAGPLDVNNTEDLVDTDLSDNISGAGNDKSTLRSAIMQANATPGLDTITLPAGTFNLTISGQDEDSAATGDLDINEDVIIVGVGATETIIDAKQLDRVFHVASDAKLTLRNLTVTGGSGQLGGGIYGRGDVVLETVRVQGNASMGDGGGVYAKKKLDLTNSTITGNTATSGGGGIRAASGSNVKLLDSLIASNTAGTSGGGLYLSTGLAEGTNVTFSGNQAATGGAIETASWGSITLTHGTIANNRAANQGGGLRNVDGDITLRNTIVATNLSTGSHTNVDLDGEFTSEGNNIIGVGGTATGFTHGTKNDIVGSSSSPIAPGITPLGDYGGPAQVHSLVEGSIAIDAANDFYSPDHDQRGIGRPQDGDANNSALTDIGAMEFILLGEIRGVKYHDRNANGQQDPGEEGLAGWTIIATPTDIPGQGNVSTVTAADGSYVLADLAPGDYVVSETVQEGWTQTDPAPPAREYLADPTLNVTDTIQAEGDSGTQQFVFPVKLSWTAENEVTVDYHVTDLTTSSDDFVSRTGTLTIPAGNTSGQITLSLQADTDREITEAFRLHLSNSSGATLATEVALGYILNDDATFVVNSTLDKPDLDPGDGQVTTGTDGEITLRAAIMETNALGGHHGIRLPAGTFALSISGSAEDLGATGDLDVTAGSVTIIGAGADQTRIDAAGLDRVLDLQSGVKVEVADATLSGGIAATGEDGGGLRARDADLYLYRVTLDGNQATDQGGGLAASSNTMMNIIQSRFSDNIAPLGGGGVFIDGSTSAMLTAVEIENNTSLQGDGGGLLSIGSVSLLESTVQGNTGARGGGVYLYQEGTVQGTVIHDNQTTSSGHGGGLYIAGDSDDTGQFHVAGVTIYENFSFNDGGGVVVTGAAKIANSTISDNIAMQHGGGIITDTSTSNLTLLSNTITNNRVGGSGGGISRRSGTISIGNTIVAGNDALTDGPDLSGPFTSVGHNLVGIDAELINVGDTFPVYVPSLSSPALDAGDNDLLSQMEKPLWAPPDGDYKTHLLDLGTDTAKSPLFTADVDNDGDIDILSRNNDNNRIIWYENNGRGSFTRTSDTGSTISSVGQAVDLDHDGDVDILSPYAHVLYWNKNDGDGLFTSYPIVRDGALYAMTTADMDGDNDIDIVGTYYNSVGYFVNDGNDIFTYCPNGCASNSDRTSPGDMRPGIWNQIASTPNSDTLVVVDLDRDNVLDVLTADYQEGSLYWHQRGAGGITHTLATDLHQPSTLQAADMDGDGDIDIVSNGKTLDALAWHENDGSQGFTLHTFSTRLGHASKVLATDVDGDGDMDIVALGTRGQTAEGGATCETDCLAPEINDGPVAWFENDGNGNFTHHKLEVPAALDLLDVAAADLDGDGDMDVISSGGHNASSGNLITWHEIHTSRNWLPAAIRNAGAGAVAVDSSSGPRLLKSPVPSPPIFVTHIIGAAPNDIWNIHAADVNSDGNIDLLSASDTSDLIAWYENDGNENFSRHTVSSEIDSGRSVHTADIDGDGDIDVLSASFNDDQIAWHENNGSEQFTLHTITNSAVEARSVYAVDIDDDGDMDVLSASFGDNKIAWYENNGNGTFAPHTITTTALGAWSVYAADVDSDGDVDVLSASSGSNAIAWYENDGNEQFTTHGIASTGAQDVYAVDVDGDGDIDVLSANGNEISLHQNDGDEHFSAHALTTTALEARGVHALDVDLDGDVDVLSASTSDDTVAWYQNHGGTNFTERLISTNLNAPTSVYAVDVDNDGDIDVLSGGYPGPLAWHENVTAVDIAAVDIGAAERNYVQPPATRSISVASGAVISGANFGDLALPGSVSGTHFMDTDGDGVQDADEVGIPDSVIIRYHHTMPPGPGTHPNQPTLSAISDLDVSTATGTSEITVPLSGISAGSDGPQHMAVTATSNNTSLIPHPLVNYIIGESTGSINFTPVADAFGSAHITVTVEDAGDDKNMSTSGDNLMFSRTFLVNVSSSSYFPALAAISNLYINMDADEQIVMLSGITSGPETGLPLRVTATSSNTDLIPNPIVTYQSGDPTGSLNFTPIAGTNGSAIITVFVETGGQDRNLSTAEDNNTVRRTFMVGVGVSLTVTDGLGYYRFDNVAAIDNYGILAEPAAGRQQTTPEIPSFTLDAGQSVSNLNFGSKHLPASLSGQIFRDLDMDGINDGSEGGLEGWTVYLDADSSGTPGSGDPQTTTDSSGHYSFTDLDPFQTYTINQVRKSGHMQTGPKQPSGVSNTLVSVHANSPHFQNLSDLVGTGTGEFYFTGLDSSGRGFNSQELFHYEPNSESVTLLTSVNAPTGITTDGNQVYWIDQDQQGNPVILRRDRAQASNEILYPRFESDTQLVNPVDLEVISTSDQGTQIAILDGDGGRLWKLLATQTSNTITAIGAARYSAGTERSHRSYLSLDEHNAYVADPGLVGFGDTAATIASLPLAGGSWQTLYTGTLAKEARGISVNNATVHYSRGNEIYQLPTTGADPTLLVSDDRFGYLGGLWFENDTLYAVDTINMSQAVSWQISFDSHYTPSANKGWTVTPEAGEQVTSLDFGDIDAASLGGASSDSRITGRVYQDINGNGQLDNSETGLASITLFLDLNNNGNLDEGEPTQLTLADNPQTTDENEAGLYAFSSLGAGTYSVTPVVPESLKQIGPLETQFAVSSLPVPDGPRTTASGDFNGDGLPDLVVGSGNSNQVSVLLNLGQGSFSDPVDYTTGVGPSDIAIADLDSDGQLDLLVSNLYSASVSILKGKADGTFDSAQSLVTGYMPTGVELADVNQDTYLDIVVTNEYPDSVSVLPGKASGGFDAKIDFPAGDAPQGLVLLDFDNDNDLDMAVPNLLANTITLLTNNGSGSYAIASQPAVGTGPFSISAGDINGDGDTDLVVANVLGDDISLLFANGSGGFDSAISVGAGQGPTGTSLVDVDADGDLDIAVSNSNSTNLSILVNQGNGTFQTPVSYGVGRFLNSLPFDVITDDLDGDGKPDFVVTNSNDNRLTLLTNRLGPSPAFVEVDGDGNKSNIDIQLNDTLPPTVGLLADLEVIENSGELEVALRNITPGLDEMQPLQVEVDIAHSTLVSVLTVDYSTPATTGTLNIQPATDKFGSSVVTVTVTDGGQDANLATPVDNMVTTAIFTYSVIEVINVPPTLNGINTTTIDEDAPLQTINLAGISPGADEDQPLSITATSSNTDLVPHPEVTYASPAVNGSLAFTPAANASGSAVITVTVTDGGADNQLATAGDNASTSQQFTVTVTPVNDPPTLATISDPAAINEDAAEQTVSFSGITAGPGETQVMAVTASSNNIALMPDPTVTYVDAQATGSLKYTPVTDAFGSAVITVTVTDGGADNNLATAGDNLTTSQQFTVTVNPLNDPPTLATISDPAAIDEDATEQTVNFSGVTAGPGETQVLAVTASSNNTALIPAPTVTYVDGQATGSLNYTPVADGFGSADITVTVTDGGADNQLATPGDNYTTSHRFTVNVNPVNDPPTLATISDPAAIDEDAAEQTVTITGIDAGPGETQHLSVTATSNNTALIPNPTVTYTDGEATASLKYTPVAETSGTAVITVTLTDAGADNQLSTSGDNLSTTRTFTVNVAPANVTPTLAGINTTTIDEDAPLQTVQLSNITAGGDDDQPLRVTATSSNTDLVPHPSVSYTSGETTGNISFQGVADGFGSSVITVSVTDGGPDKNLETTADNASFQQSFTVNITSVNDKPASSSATFEPPENTLINVAAENGLLALSSDVEESPLTFTIVTSTAYGELTSWADGRFTYQPNQGFNRSDFFTYRVNDGTEDGNLARINFDIATLYAWYNCLKPLDVNDDALTTPLDVLWIINNLNANGSGTLVNARPKPLAAPFYDVNKDGVAAPLDALIIINALNQGVGEGEGASSRGYYETPLSTGPLNVAPVRSAASTMATATTPAATQLLPHDDAYRTAALSDQAADLLGDRTAARRWEAAVDQLLEEELDSLWDDNILP